MNENDIPKIAFINNTVNMLNSDIVNKMKELETLCRAMKIINPTEWDTQKRDIILHLEEI